ncbi:MAG: hypothetical protein GQ559_04205 [Desulfobulbaceae bacterium]|nr:hypothetical protein [Desulfobulbaceae bacterium]
MTRHGRLERPDAGQCHPSGSCPLRSSGAGCTLKIGANILLTLMNQMKRENQVLGLASFCCIGGGQGQGQWY